MAKDQKDVEVQAEPIDDKQELEVNVVEAKEGLMSKAKKHWKIIAGAAAAGVLIVGAKVLKSRKSETCDEDYDEFDDDFDDDVVDGPDVTADPK